MMRARTPKITAEPILPLNTLLKAKMNRIRATTPKARAVRVEEHAGGHYGRPSAHAR